MNAKTAEQKTQIRNSIINQRKQLTENEWLNKSTSICTKILNEGNYINSNVILCYASVRHEVDLSLVINDALSKGKAVGMPKVIDNIIKFYRINSLNDLKPGYFNVPEPEEGLEIIDADLVLVPGVAFTKKGKRLGYGGGFYDRFLKEKKINTIGIAFDFQIFEDLPTEEHDMTLNKVISDIQE